MASLPTIKQLRYLVELEKHRHFGRAAEASFVSQSAFSVAIRELESNLDVKLVDRTNRSVTFTPIGKQITAQDLAAFINGLDMPDEAKSLLADLTPENYLGNAEEMARKLDDF